MASTKLRVVSGKPSDPKSPANVVQFCKDMLALAEAGKMTAISVVYDTPSGEIAFGSALGPNVNILAMVGCMDLAQVALLGHLDG